jgi:creatinine amidohydrolase
MVAKPKSTRRLEDAWLGNRSSTHNSVDIQDVSERSRKMKKRNLPGAVVHTRISRRCFMQTMTAATLCLSRDVYATQSTGKQENIKRNLSAAVQMQFMRPGQLEKAIRDFPVVYVPFGLIEWHGKHLPLGNDALKAHGILVKTAERFGGVVYPPVFFHEGFPQEFLVPVLTELFQRLKKTGFRVILGVSGHNVQGQIDMLNKALAPVVADATAAGVGLWEITLSRCDESNTDHAAKWETSNMMFFYPELVDISALGDGPLAPNMKPPDGIGGLDPRKHASLEVGRRNVELASQAIGRKAKELLESMPQDERSFKLPVISPEHWWMI